MSDKKVERRKVKITTGPFLVPEEVDSELQGGRENDRIIIILKNPTDEYLKVKVKLGICLEPKKSPNGLFNVYKDIEEKEVSLGWFNLKPHSCTRIERNKPRDLGAGKDERNAVFRITAKGDFNVCSRGDTVLCGLAEISVIGGSVFNFQEPGLEQADAALFFPFRNFVVCKSYD
ncbi:hypothetical protein QUF49_15095 [Fictibacillus sp. b24]|uniref:hypothetical protein n=1 Tax=unclassified Fictibacillus TaxID=2644029 RepID=UPI0025A286D0|nr:hypothetical protein [Fictibacillus sp. b24]MDM5317335.1 hypothetical protein [Fictibacillus sp. b24]